MRIPAIAAALLLAPVAGAGAAPFSDIYVFGDSLSDVGNVKFGSDLLGITPNPVGPPYFEGRFSNGPIYVDFLGAALTANSRAGIPSLPQFLNPLAPSGTNFAVGGARAATNADGLPDLEAQLGGEPQGTNGNLIGFPGFLQYLGGGALDRNALYLISTGNNDARAIANGDADAPAPEDAAESIIEAINFLAFFGARHFALMGPGDLGLEPVFNGNEAAATAASAAVNDAIEAGIAPYGQTGTYVIPSSFGPISFTYFDFFEWTQAVVDDPEAFGLPAGIDTETPCFLAAQSNPGVLPDCAGFAWADGIHPTSIVHQALGNSLLPLLLQQQVPAPATLALFGLGVVALAGGRRRVR